MARSHRSARQAGTAAERAVADYLAQQLGDDRIDRRPKTGARDRGDVGGIRLHSQRVVVEVKNCARTDLAGWTAQAHTEACNDDSPAAPCLVGVTIHKRRGTTDVGRWYVTMTVDDWLAHHTGHRHGHRQEDFA